MIDTLDQPQAEPQEELLQSHSIRICLFRGHSTSSHTQAAPLGPIGPNYNKISYAVLWFYSD